MNWTSELIDLYDKNVEKAGLIETRSEPPPLLLLPIFHNTVIAQVEVTIDDKGRFIQADVVPEEAKVTIIPVSEKSGSRTSHFEPHPLVDDIRYLAGDYFKYYKGKKIKDDIKYFPTYIEALRKWKESDQSHPKVSAIYGYLNEETLVEDLINSKILELDEQGKLTDTIKVQKVDQTKVVVRFRIMDQEALKGTNLDLNSDEYHVECWLDRELQQKYIEYVQLSWKEKGLSYVSGEIEKITYHHPKKIRNEGDGTKLFSSNDDDNYTFRGRFHNDKQAYAIGYEESQKIHNALKWIVRKQGFFKGELTIVIWDSDNNPLPEWDRDTYDIIDDFGDEDDPIIEDNSYLGTNEISAASFNKAIRGYKSNLKTTSRTVLIALDSLSPGRVSLIENKQFETARYIDNLEYWHTSGAWLHEKWKDKKRITYYGMPTIYEIIRLLYGHEQGDNNDLTLPKKGNFNSLYKRLLPCITDRKKMPIDLIRLAINRASSPQSFHDKDNWESVVTLACSLYKKHRCEYEKEEWDLGLNEDCKERDYLYGRLLAVAQWVEQQVSFRKDDNRETNAKRYMSAFSKRPFSTWKIIEEKMQPYMKKLYPAEQNKYNTLLHKIQSEFEVEVFINNKELNGLYLLGYHQQMFKLQKSKEEGLKE